MTNGYGFLKRRQSVSLLDVYGGAAAGTNDEQISNAHDSETIWHQSISGLSFMNLAMPHTVAKQTENKPTLVMDCTDYRE